VSPDAAALERARAVAGAVVDPELPMIGIGDLGVLRDVRPGRDEELVVVLTPTYTGCPAMGAIETDVRAALSAAGFDPITICTQIVPPWSTDDISPAGREALRSAGVAPPSPVRTRIVPLTVRCPACGSPDTEELSRFGSTACTSLWRCRACAEPFSRVKPF
jgi:ring-1,2-phenylacetyl-CoA epoxidase subunit PaaD